MTFIQRFDIASHFSLSTHTRPSHLRGRGDKLLQSPATRRLSRKERDVVFLWQQKRHDAPADDTRRSADKNAHGNPGLPRYSRPPLFCHFHASAQIASSVRIARHPSAS